MTDLSVRLLDDKELIFSEVAKLQVFYTLKRVIRYHHTREEVIDTESTAEHIYGMMVLARYFLPLENQESDWDINKINDMILYHDLDEVETGDTIDYLKEEHTLETQATQKVIAQLPESQQAYLTELMTEYAKQESPEAKFVKAIDKFEPLIHLFNKNGKELLLAHGTTYKQFWGIKHDAIKSFPIIYRFMEILVTEMNEKGFLTPEPSGAGAKSKG